VSFWAIVLPILAALSYVAAAMFIKRAAELRAGVWRTAFVCNVASAICFQPLLLLGGQTPSLSQWWQPAVVAILFLSGQIWTFVSLGKGDVSVATPVLGVKILLVAGFATLLTSQPLSLKMWISSALATVSIALLNRSGAHGRKGNVTHTIITAGLAAVSYALFDVLIQKWAAAWGIGRFLPATIGLVGVYSLALIPLFERPLTELSRGAQRALFGAAFFMTLQALMFISTIAYFRNAAAANVIYSSRGLWSIAAVWLVGHWFHNTEKQLGPAALRWRIAGAVLMFAAIVLVLI
jgi:drug/metabolite transporter (DMT)-like permease